LPKILMVVADGAPGGGTTAVLGLCQDLARVGWTPVLTTQTGSYGLDAGRQMGIETHGLDFFRSRIDPWIPFRVADVVSAVRPDLIHLHGARAGHAFCSLRLRPVRTPIVYTVHGYHFLKKPPARRALGWVAERRIARRAQHVVFVSENDQATASRLKLLSAAPRRSTVIYNGIDPTDLEVGPAEPPSHDLVFAARLVPQKNPLFLVDVMAALAGDGARLLLVGGGELEQELRAAAQARGVADRITFTGALGRAETLKALRRAKIFLFPSLWEGLPIGPIEAMHYGLPVVGSKIGGTDEVVADGVTGILLDAFDPARYAGAIRQLLADEPRRRAMGAAGRERVASMFERRSCTDRHRQLYERLL
jgi:glycosyltransferase involved in cell wall biosynthesis